MAKKKITTEEIIDDTPELDYKDIKDKSEEEIIAAGDEEAKKAAEEAKVKEEADAKEAKDKEDAEAKEKADAEVKEEEKIDPKKLTQDIKDEIIAGLTGKKEEKVDEYEAWAKKIFDETGQAPNWKQAAEFIKEGVKRDYAAEQAKAQEEAKTRGEEQKKVQETEVERVNKYVDDQMNELYLSNKFPKIKDEKDEKDTGVIARRALLEQVMKVNKERVEKGLQTKTIKEVFYEDYKSPTRQPAGADVPISAGRGAGSHDDTEEIDYMRDVKGKSWIDIALGRK